MLLFMIPNVIINILLLAALIPPIVLMVMVYRQDKIEKEPVGLIIRLVLFGCLSTIPAVILEILADLILSALLRDTASMLYLILENFLGVAVIEEGCKYFFLHQQTWRNREFNYRFDGIVYAVSVSLGFAALENVQYVFSYGLGTAVTRALLAIPLHCICGIFMGHYYGEAKFAEVKGLESSKSRNLILAILVPTLIHGFYDFALSTQSGLITIIFIIYVIALDVIAFRSIRKFSNEDIGFYQSSGFDYWR